MEAPSRYAWAPSLNVNFTTLPRFFKPQIPYFLRNSSNVVTVYTISIFNSKLYFTIQKQPPQLAKGSQLKIRHIK